MNRRELGTVVSPREPEQAQPEQPGMEMVGKRSLKRISSQGLPPGLGPGALPKPFLTDPTPPSGGAREVASSVDSCK